MNANFKKYASIVLVVCLLATLVSFVACKDKNEPEKTTTASQPADVVTTTAPQDDKPNNTTPAQTTPAQPTETVTFPSDEEVDPKQEDVFFE